MASTKDMNPSGQDEMVKLSTNQTSPYLAKGSDWKVKVPAAGSGEEGMNQLDKLSVTQEGPRHTEDSGPGTPVPTDRSAKVSANFKEMKNSNESGTSLSFGASVDFGKGNWTGGVNYKK